MRILGIETSCDETAAAVVEDGHKLLSSVVASSVDLHAVYGGVVPEIASRSHLETIIPVIEQALNSAFQAFQGRTLEKENMASDLWEEIDAIAVTQGPGLSGSLLIGVMTARTLAIAKNKPLFPVNHVEAHVYANFLTSTASSPPVAGQSPTGPGDFLDNAVLETPILSRSSKSTTSSDSRFRLALPQNAADVKEWKLGEKTYILPSSPPRFPLLALIVSGGHSQLVLFGGHGDYRLLGQTKDDAVGEAFDKVAKIVGLPYPGGPSVSAAAESGNPDALKLPTAKMENKYDFSFSGLKTAVLRASQTLAGKGYDFPSTGLSKLLNKQQVADIAASFQRTAVLTLVNGLKIATAEFKPASIVISGGVAANQELRSQLDMSGLTPVFFPDIKLCTDNAAMIASLGYFRALNLPPADPYSVEILPNYAM